MKHSSGPIIAALSAALLGLTGCGHDQFPSYSASIKYPLRQDPFLMVPAAQLGDERYEPDTPGQFPIMHLDDIFKPGNPIEPKAKEIVSKEALRDPTRLSSKDKQDLEAALEAIFGTPAKPMVNAEKLGLDAKTVAELKIDPDTLDKGSRQFRVHCLHCHGVSGDGRGPTSRWINPHPRDFRAAKFKFQSVDQATDGRERLPMRSDLMRTLREGLEGTAMPSFRILRDDELEWIVSYVIHLTLRGDAERTTLKENFDWDKNTGALTWKKDEDSAENPLEAVKLWTGLTVKRWVDSQHKPIKVAPYPYAENDKDAWAASVKRGFFLFTGDEQHYKGASKAKCVQCHVDFGKQAKYRFDDWATLVRPNNFSAGVFRGGHRPIDKYFRIHSGINGSGMNNFGSVLKGEEIWDLVNFVSALPYPAMLKEAGVNAK